MFSAQQQLWKLCLWRDPWYSSSEIESALQKIVPNGLTISFFIGDRPLFRLELLVLIRLSRPWKGFWSDRTDSGKSSIQTILTITQNYPDPSPSSNQTLQTLGGLWSDCPDRRQWCQTLWIGCALPPFGTLVGLISAGLGRTPHLGVVSVQWIYFLGTVFW